MTTQTPPLGGDVDRNMVVWRSDLVSCKDLQNPMCHGTISGREREKENCELRATWRSAVHTDIGVNGTAFLALDAPCYK